MPMQPRQDEMTDDEFHFLGWLTRPGDPHTPPEVDRKRLIDWGLIDVEGITDKGREWLRLGSGN